MPSSPSLPSPRLLNLAAALVGGALLGYAYWAQFGLGLEPCPLCILQRIALIGVTLAFLGAAAHGATGGGRYGWAAVIALTTGSGVALAGRHVWLQSLPPELVPACGPGLNYLVEALPLFDALAEAFHGSGECAEVDWRFLGLSMPAWTLACFVLLGAGGVWNNLRRVNR
jgi:disulfide bond formation protein DsbB